MDVHVVEDAEHPSDTARIECGPHAPLPAQTVVWVGRAGIEATTVVKPDASGGLTCRLHPLAARRLLLPPASSVRWQARIDAAGLHLGPVIAYFAGDGRAEDPLNLLGWLQLRLAPCAVRGLLYAFTLNDLRLGQPAVYGRLWQDGGFAAPSVLPMPDVIWKGAEAAVPWLPRVADGRIFNERLTWNKAEAHQALAGRPHVPPAVAVTLAADTFDRDRVAIARLLDDGGAVYLKAVYGSLRVGVGRLSAASEGWLFEDASASVGGMPEEVLAAVRDRLPSAHGYLAQQAIPPLADGRRLDFRVIVQRGADAGLSCTAIGALLGPAGGPFSKTKPSGAYYPPHATLIEQGLPGDRADALLGAIAGGATEAAACLESVFGHIGEAAFDVTVDPEWNWWLLEANPRPGVLGFQGLDAQRFPHIAGSPLEYAVTMAGYR